MSRSGAYSKQKRRGVPFANEIVCANYADRDVFTVTGISSWLDQVGNRHWAQATTTKQPPYGTFGTYPAAAPDGTDDFLKATAVTLSPYASITFSMSFLFTGGTTKYIYEVSTANVAGGFRIYEANATSMQIIFYNTGAQQSKTITGLTAGTIYRLIFVLNASAAAVTFPLTYLNNAVQGSATGTSDRGFADLDHYAMERAGTTGPWGGKLGDHFIHNRALTAAEISTLDAWMAMRAA